MLPRANAFRNGDKRVGFPGLFCQGRSTPEFIALSALAVISAAPAANGELPHDETPRNVVQAAVYRHILAWMPRTRVIDRTGRRWLVRTATEFIQLGKGLPWAAWTIRKAIRGLAADGWIEVRHGPHPFGDREYQQHCTWITLLERPQNSNVAVQSDAHRATFGATFDPPTEQHSTITSKVSTRRQSGAASQSAPPRAGNTPLREAGEIGSSIEASSATVGENSELSTIETVQLSATEDTSLPTADEVVAALKAKRPPAADPKKLLRPQALYHEFARGWVDTFPGEAVAPANTTRLGQIKHLLAYLRTERAADPEIVAMVHKAVRDWPGFVAFVAARGGPKLAEARPSIAALLTHRDKLVNFHRAPVVAENNPDDPLYMPDGLKPLKKQWKPKNG